jgi:hypothetical protein
MITITIKQLGQIVTPLYWSITGIVMLYFQLKEWDNIKGVTILLADLAFVVMAVVTTAIMWGYQFPQLIQVVP